MHLLDGGDRHQLLHLDLRERKASVAVVPRVQHLVELRLALPPLPLLLLQPLPLGPERKIASICQLSVDVARHMQTDGGTTMRHQG